MPQCWLRVDGTGQRMIFGDKPPLARSVPGPQNWTLSPATTIWAGVDAAADAAAERLRQRRLVTLDEPTKHVTFDVTTKLDIDFPQGLLRGAGPRMVCIWLYKIAYDVLSIAFIVHSDLCTSQP